MKIRTTLSLSCLLLSACSGGSNPEPISKVLGRFQRAADCQELKSYVEGYAKRARDYSDRAVPVVQAGPTVPNDATAGGGEAPAEDSAGSPGTVIQSDFAFADTERGLLHVFAGKSLKILRASPAAEARVLGQIAFDFPPQELATLKVGEKYFAVVFGGQSYGGIEPMPVSDVAVQPSEEKVVMAVLDVSDPAQPKRLLQESAPGRFLEARALVEGGKIAWVSERWIYLGEKVEDAALFPEKTSLRDGAANQLPLSGCENTLLYQNESLDADYAPYSLTATTISLLDLNQAGLPVSSQAIVSPAWRTMIAANADHLLLAQNVDGAERSDTELYRFDLGGDSPLAFLDATQVPGNILNQFFIDEKEGVLRVFHNLPPAFISCPNCGVEGDPGPDTVVGSTGALKAQAHNSELAPGNYLSTYRAGALLGRSGPFESDEVPYAARFLGGLGCVITYMQIDPLTCFDLKDPAKPTRLGELEIEGVSFHLEDLGQGYLLGIGQGAAGQVVANLFDVRDPSRPQLANQLNLSSSGDWSSSSAFYDPRALAKSADARNFAVPLDQSNGSKLALFSVDLAARQLSSEGELLKPFNDSSYDSYQRAYFFADSLGALSSQEAEILLRSDLSEVFSLPLEN